MIIICLRWLFAGIFLLNTVSRTIIVRVKTYSFSAATRHIFLRIPPRFGDQLDICEHGTMLATSIRLIDIDREVPGHDSGLCVRNSGYSSRCFVQFRLKSVCTCQVGYEFKPVDCRRDIPRAIATRATSVSWISFPVAQETSSNYTFSSQAMLPLEVGSKIQHLSWASCCAARLMGQFTHLKKMSN